jgi:hypothetical protein
MNVGAAAGYEVEPDAAAVVVLVVAGVVPEKQPLPSPNLFVPS